MPTSAPFRAGRQAASGRFTRNVHTGEQTSVSGSRRLSAHRHPLLGHPVPPRSSAPLAIGLPDHDSPDPTGFPRSAHTRHDRGGRPLYPEASGVPTAGGSSPAAACRLSQRPGPIARVFLPSSRAVDDGASSGVHCRSPSGLPLARSLPWTERGPLGFFPELRTPTTRSCRRTSGRGLISNTDQELRIRHRRPPICEFTRCARPRVAPTRST